MSRKFYLAKKPRRVRIIWQLASTIQKVQLNWLTRHQSLLKSPPDRGTRYSTTVVSQDYRYFIEMPTTWVPFPQYIEPDLPGSDFIPVGSTRRRYFTFVEARLRFKWKSFVISLWFFLCFKPNFGQHEYSAYENPNVAGNGLSFRASQALRDVFRWGSNFLTRSGKFCCQSRYAHSHFQKFVTAAQ